MSSIFRVCPGLKNLRSTILECNCSNRPGTQPRPGWAPDPLLTNRGQKLRISHGLKCVVQLRRKEATPATEHVESLGQFNLIGFVDDLSLFAQTLGGAQALLEAIQEFELWIGLKVNRKKTCAMVVDLGVWGTPTGDMSNTKERIFKRTEEARDLLRQ